MTTDAPPRPTIALGPPRAALARPAHGDAAPSVRRRAEYQFGHADVLAAIAGLSFVVARFVPVLGALPSCPFRSALGIPCASCGMTRAFVALAHGDLGAALAGSPLGVALAAGAWGVAALALARPVLRFGWPRLAPAAARAVALAGVAALLVNWGWLVASGRLHP